MNELSLGEAAPLRYEVGDIMTSLSLPYLAVPVFGSIVTPLLIRFGSLMAPASSMTSLPSALSYSSFFFLAAFYSAVYFLPNPVRSYSLSESESSSATIFDAYVSLLFKAYLRSPF